MKNVISNQYEHECDILKTTIAIVEEENVVLKTRLAGMVSSRFMDNAGLDHAEQIQSQLVLLDETIRGFKEDLYDLQKQYEVQSLKTGSTELLFQLENLQIKLEKIKEEFIALKKNLERFVLQS